MTNTEMNCYGIPRETIEKSMRRARRLRSRVMYRFVRRLVRGFSPGRLQTASATIRATVQPA